MSRRISLAVLVGLLTLAHTAPSHAQESTGAYLGASVGRASFDSFDDRDSAFAVFGGYRFNRYLSLEAAYADLGRSERRIQSCPLEACIPENFPNETRLSVNRVEAVLLASAPVGERFDLFAKVGAAHSRSKYHYWDLTSDYRHTTDDTSAIYGVGARFHLAAQWAFRLQWDRVDADQHGDLDTYWAGVEYRFGGSR